MERREPVALTRPVEAIQVPSGFPVILPAGAWVTVQQVLGGNLTVMTERGGLARVAAADADALGESWVEEARQAAAREKAGAVAAPSGGGVTQEQVLEELRTVYDPEIPVNIVELGLVYLVGVEPLPEGGHKVVVRMTLTAPGCGVGSMIVEDVRYKVQAIPGVSQVDVELVFDPPWEPSRMTEAARLQLGFM